MTDEQLQAEAKEQDALQLEIENPEKMADLRTVSCWFWLVLSQPGSTHMLSSIHPISLSTALVQPCSQLCEYQLSLSLHVKTDH